MLLTVWTNRGRKSIHLPLEALDEVKKIVYNDDRIIEYSVSISDYEKIERLDNGVVQKDNETEVRSESLLDENG